MADRPVEADAALVRGALTRAASEIEYRDGRQPWVDEGLAALDQLTARLSEAERAPTYDHEWVSGIINQNNERGRRLSDYEQALRGLLGRVDYHLGSGSALFPAFQNAVDVARAALSSDHILTKDVTDSN